MERHFKFVTGRGRQILATALLFVLTATAVAAANPSATLEQCRNGTFASPVHCDHEGGANGYVTGNAGSSDSHWREGDSIAYRMMFDNLTPGAHEVTIEWDTTKAGKHAIDYLTTYNRTESVLNDPCVGVTGCTGANVTRPIPLDSNAVNQVAGVFTCFGCTSIDSTSPYTVSGTYAGDSSTRITIFFTVGSTANPVLAWGGHIATQIDWGTGNSAVNISGSPYHMRLIELDGAGGNQDRSLSAAAVVGLGASTHRSGTGTLAIGALISDTLYLTGTNSLNPIAGSVQFGYCSGPAGINFPTCTISNTTNFGGLVALGTNGSCGTACNTVSVSSSDIAFGATGDYCFVATFIPTAGSDYPGFTNLTNQVYLGATAECFIVTNPTAVTVSSFEATNQPAMAADFSTLGLGLAGLLALGAVALIVWRKR